MYSYRESQSNLEKLTVHRCLVNNHNKIKLMTNQVGAVLAQENLLPPAAEDCAPLATEAIVQVKVVLQKQFEDRQSSSITASYATTPKI